MRSFDFLKTLAFTSLGVLACTEPDPSGPSLMPPAPGSGPAGLSANAPAESGPIVVRSSGLFFLFIFDSRQDRFALHIARDGSPGFCGGDPPTIIRPGQFQDILNPSDEQRILEMFQAQGAFVTIYAWEGQDIFETPEILCDFLTNGPEIGRGTANLTSTDNDLHAFERPNHNANAFGFVAQGKVQVDGQMVHYNGVSRCVWDGEDPSSIKCVDRINLR